MLRKVMTAAVLGLSLAALPALAQNTNAPAGQSTANNKSEPPHETASSKSLWQGSKLIGLNVYDQQNEKIGDIKDLMLNKQGQIDTVAVGVGGFLGMGEHDVAVKYTDLKFSDEPVKTNTSANRPAGGSSTMGAGGGGGTSGAASSSSSSTSSGPKNYPDHAVLNVSKDQLKSMPQFDYNK